MGLIPTLNHPVAGNSRVPGPLYDNDVAIRAVVNGGIEAANITAGAVTDTCLASPNNLIYRLFHRSDGYGIADMVAGTYYFSDGNPLTVSGGANVPQIIYINSGYAVSSKTTKLRLTGWLASNATAPGITFTFGLYPVTVAGSADVLTATLGTVVTGSTIAMTTPSASTVTPAVGADFTLPATGAYVLGVVTSGTLANNCAYGIGATLEMGHT